MGIKFFEDVDELSNLAGGKGVSLAKLYKNNFNVPNGFVIEANVFDEFLISNNIKNDIQCLIEKCNVNDDNSIEKASIRIYEMISKCELTEEVKQEIINNYRRLDCEYVAVRSSAISEDGKNSAWAGQLESFLNVRESDVIDAVKKCFLSNFSKRAIFYRIKNTDISDISVAVVVQKMVQSEVSGVGFSVNPINNNPNECIIESILGLGEAIVSGSVSPDTYIIDKDINQIKSKDIKNQNRKLIKVNEENEWIDINDGNLQKLDDNMIIELFDIIKRLEEFYGFPVDVEWGSKDSEIYILQCRPITTVKSDKITDLISKLSELKKWEYYVTRKFNWFSTNTEIHATKREVQKEFLGFDLALNNHLILNGDEYSLGNDFEVIYRKLKKNFDDDINFFDKFAKKEFELVEDIKLYIEKLYNTDFNCMTLEQLYEEIKTFDRIYVYSFITGFTRPDDVLEFELKRELKESGFDEKEIDKIFSKVATCPDLVPLSYSEEPLELLKIALDMRNGKNIENELDSHIQKYAWMKAPLVFEDTYFTKEDYIERLENLKSEDIENRIKNIVDIRRKNYSDYKEILKEYNFSERVLKIAEAIRNFIVLRTYTTEYSDNLFFVAKHTLFMAIAKKLEISIDDFIMLSDEEILESLKIEKISETLKNRIVDRRKGFAIVWVNSQVETFCGEEALYLQAEIAKEFKVNESDDTGTSEIHGMVANCGKVVGRVRILLDYNDTDKVEKGDIIVASMTTPDYISAMEKASGFITDEGGITCHAAIISREFNVPCIVGTVNATEKLRNGQMIELDAYNGIVKLID